MKKKFSAPYKYDPDLWYLDDCGSNDEPTKHYIIGDGQTFPGRVSIWCEAMDKITNASLDEMKDLSPKAKIWMEGFLVGSGPDYPEIPDDPYGYACHHEESRNYGQWQEICKMHTKKLQSFYKDGSWSYYGDEMPMRKIVIGDNDDLHLSQRALEELGLMKMISYGGSVLPTEPYEWCDIARDDPRLVEIIETMGDRACVEIRGGQPIQHKAKIIEIPITVDWEVCSSDMHVEWVQEKHRVWS